LHGSKAGEVSCLCCIWLLWRLWWHNHHDALLALTTVLNDALADAGCMRFLYTFFEVCDMQGAQRNPDMLYLPTALLHASLATANLLKEGFGQWGGHLHPRGELGGSMHMYAVRYGTWSGS
jgi:hypothetical protein